MKNHHVFSDKFVLNVLDLTQIELATDEDRQCEIDYWARLFKAKTWEDLRMVVEKNKYMSAAAEEMYERNADETIREKCRAREEYYRHQRWIQKQLEEKDQIIAEREQTIDAMARERAEREQTIDAMVRERAEDKRLIAELQAELSNR